MASLRKQTTNANKDAGRRREESLALLVEMLISQPLWKSAWGFLKTIKIELQYDAARPFLGIYLKESGSKYSRDTCTPGLFITAPFTITKLWKEPRCPSVDGWMDGWMGG
jgi:hypothetical protein